MTPRKGRQPLVEQEQSHPLHHRCIEAHGAVDVVPLPVREGVGRLRHVRERCHQLAKEQAVFLAPYPGREPGERVPDQPVGGPIGAQLVMRDEEPRPVGEIRAQLLAKENPSAQVGKVLLDRDVPPGKTGPGQRADVDQELAHEDIEHGNRGSGANTAFGQRRGKSAPAPQHPQER